MVHTPAMDAFELLVEIEQRARQFAASLPRPSQHDVLWIGICFKLGEEYFVTPLTELVEILAIPEVTRLPCMQPWVIGVANVRGEPLPIVDLAAYLKLSEAVGDVRSRILVVNHNDIKCGLWVNQVLGLEHFYRDQALLESVQPKPNFAAYFRGAIQRDDIARSILSLQALIADPAFLQVVQGT